MINITVSSEDNNIRLDRFFKRHFPNVPFGTVAKLIRKKDIKVNSKRADISSKIFEGDIISFPTLQEHSTEISVKPKIKAKDIELIQNAVVFKDDNIIVLNKPAGLAVQGGSKINISVDDLSEYLKFEYEDKPKLVHRIDKETSGLLVLARKTSVAAELSALIKNKKFQKTYLALCLNIPKNPSGKIDLPIDKATDSKTNFEKVKHTAQGKKAITLYKVIDRVADKCSLIEAEIITGRTHQIRVHLQSIGCPIIGDHKYGMRSEVSSTVSDKLHLHAYKLSFTLNGTPYNFSAELPEYFADSLDAYGLRFS